MRRLVLFAMKIIFTACRVFPVKQHKVVLLKNFPVWGSLGAFGDFLEQQGGWQTVRQTPRSPLLLFHLATARAVLLNNNFTPLAALPLSKHTKVVQLWHADGALKQWGGDENPYPYDAVICASGHTLPYWAEAFQVPTERVLPLGSPRMDELVRPCNKSTLRTEFDARYPACKGKRLMLYAPTFRENPAQNAALLSHFDFAKFSENFPDAILLVRLHPKMHGTYQLPAAVIDMIAEPDAAALLRICDCLITDYSSLCVDAAVLDLPVVLYQFDEADYLANERGFYVPFRTLAPGAIVNTFDELLDSLALPDISKEQRRAFAEFHAGNPDGKSCERILEIL